MWKTMSITRMKATNDASVPKTIVKKQPEKLRRSRTNVLRGTPLNYSVKQQAEYNGALRDLVRQMSKETQEEFQKLIDGDAMETYVDQREELAATDASVTNEAKKLLDKLLKRFEALFSDKAKKLAERMVRDANKTSKTRLNASLKELSGGLSLNISVVPKGMETATQAMIENNVSLIKSVPKKFYTDVSTTVMQAISKGSGLKDIVPAIQAHAGVSERRVKNIARDQVRKTFNNINQMRMQAVGIQKFEWQHSGGSQHPRKDHIAMNGNIYSFDKLPIIDKRTGERGIPGQAINCRCTMKPVIEFDEDD